MESLYFNKPSLLGKQWRIKDADERESLLLQQKYGLPDIVARMLTQRQINWQNTPAFLNPQMKSALPDPSHLKDMDKGTKRLISAIKTGETIGILGDYDVDGATSTALLYRFFTTLGAKVVCYIPDRFKDGYGPTPSALASLRGKGATIIITVDCGTTAIEPLESVQSEGINIVVIDHHKANIQLPQITAVINPNRLDEDSPCRTLAAVGLCFLFAISVNRELRNSGFYQTRREPDLFSLLDLVALGTVCDVMPLQGLNRAFVSQGLKVLALRKNLGLRLMLEKLVHREVPNAYHLGFVLGPRINAGGRVGQSSLGFELLTATQEDQAEKSLFHLELFNTQRKEIEATVLKEAIEMAINTPPEASSLLLGKETWHAGVIGIVAGRLKDHFQRPTCIFSLEGNVAKGSGRSVSGFDLGNVIQKAVAQGILLTGGGHAMAAGFSLQAENIPLFKDFLEAEASSKSLSKEIILSLDGIMPLEMVSEDLLTHLDQLAPFGMGNPTPRFLIPHVRIQNSKQLGNADKGVHVRCQLASESQMNEFSLSAVAFGLQDPALIDVLLKPSRKLFHLAGTLRQDWWTGSPRLQFVIEDVQEA